MTNSGGDGSLGTGNGGSHDLDHAAEVGHSHHTSHHWEDSNGGGQLIVDLNTGTATFAVPRRIDDTPTSADAHDEPTGR